MSVLSKALYLKVALGGLVILGLTACGNMSVRESRFNDHGGQSCEFKGKVYSSCHEEWHDLTKGHMGVYVFRECAMNFKNNGRNFGDNIRDGVCDETVYKYNPLKEGHSRPPKRAEKIYKKSTNILDKEKGLACYERLSRSNPSALEFDTFCYNGKHMGESIVGKENVSEFYQGRDQYRTINTSCSHKGRGVRVCNRGQITMNKVKGFKSIQIHPDALELVAKGGIYAHYGAPNTLVINGEFTSEGVGGKDQTFESALKEIFNTNYDRESGVFSIALADGALSHCTEGGKVCLEPKGVEIGVPRTILENLVGGGGDGIYMPFTQPEDGRPDEVGPKNALLEKYGDLLALDSMSEENIMNPKDDSFQPVVGSADFGKNVHEAPDNLDRLQGGGGDGIMEYNQDGSPKTPSLYPGDKELYRDVSPKDSIIEIQLPFTTRMG